MQYRKTACHLLAALMANGLPYHDDPTWRPLVSNGRGGQVEYAPVDANCMHEAVLSVMIDQRPKDSKAKARKGIYEPAARVLGLMLKRARDNGSDTTTIWRKMMDFLLSLNDKTQENLARLLITLDALSYYLPEALLAERATPLRCEPSRTETDAVLRPPAACAARCRAVLLAAVACAACCRDRDLVGGAAQWIPLSIGSLCPLDPSVHWIPLSIGSLCPLDPSAEWIPTPPAAGHARP